MQQENTLMEIENVIHVHSEKKKSSPLHQSSAQPEHYINERFLAGMSVEDTRSFHEISQMPSWSFGHGEVGQERMKNLEHQWKQKVQVLEQEVDSLRRTNRQQADTILEIEQHLAIEKQARQNVETMNMTLQNNFLEQKGIVTALTRKYQQEIENQQRVIDDYYNIIEDFRQRQTIHLVKNTEMVQHNAVLQTKVGQLHDDCVNTHSQNQKFKKQIMQLNQELVQKEQELEQSKQQYLIQQSHQKSKKMQASANKHRSTRASLETEVQQDTEQTKTNLKALITQLNNSHHLPTHTYDTFHFSLHLTHPKSVPPFLDPEDQTLLRLFRVLMNFLKVVAIFSRQNDLDKDKKGEVMSLVELIQKHQCQPCGVGVFLDEFFPGYLELEIEDTTLDALQLQVIQMNIK